MQPGHWAHPFALPHEVHDGYVGAPEHAPCDEHPAQAQFILNPQVAHVMAAGLPTQLLTPPSPAPDPPSELEPEVELDVIPELDPELDAEAAPSLEGSLLASAAPSMGTGTSVTPTIAAQAVASAVDRPETARAARPAFFTA